VGGPRSSRSTADEKLAVEVVAAFATIFEYIEVFDNGTRRRSTLGYLSTVEFEMKFDQETSTEYAGTTCSRRSDA
jgi:hypothetical protein